MDRDIDLPLDIARGTLPNTLLSLAKPQSRAYLILMALKRRYRRGWLKVGVPESQCESVADHIYGVAMLCTIHGVVPGIPYEDAIILALIHEMGESGTGDIIPADGIDPGEKHLRESRVISTILADYPPKARGRLQGLIDHYESREGDLYGFVKAMDFLEMGYQALVYCADGFPKAVELLQVAKAGLRGSPWESYLSN